MQPEVFVVAEGPQIVHVSGLARLVGAVRRADW